MKQRQDDDVYNYRLIGPLTILQGMVGLATLGVILTMIGHYYF